MEFMAQKRAGHFSMGRMYGVIVSLMSENCILYLRMVFGFSVTETLGPFDETAMDSKGRLCL